MSQTSKPRALRLLAAPILALVLAAGLQVLWALLGTWCWELSQSFRRTDRIYESLGIRGDGTPLIIRDYYRGQRQLGKREVTTIDGEPVDNEHQVYSPEFAAPKPIEASNEVEWLARLQAYAVNKEPTEFWYFIHDGRRDGLGYFEGYGVESSRLLGYLGRSGFRADRPPPDDRFAVSETAHTYRRYQTWPPGYEPWDQLRRVDNGRRDRTTYIVSSDRVWQVNLSRRTVETIWQGAGAIDIEGIVQLHKDSRLAAAYDEADAHWGIRSLDRLHLLDINKQPAYSVPIPEAIRDVSFQAYERPEGGILFVAYDRDQYAPEAKVFWVGKSGAVEKSRNVPLLASRDRIPESLEWAGGGVLAPGSLTLTVAGVLMAYGQYFEHRAPTFVASLADRFAALWPTLVVVSLLGVILGFLALRRQERYGLGGGLGWAAFVFCFGPAGLAGYVWHRHWAVRGICPSCKSIVPLDRETCLRCGKEFPRPERLSTEIRA